MRRFNEDTSPVQSGSRLGRAFEERQYMAQITNPETQLNSDDLERINNYIDNNYEYIENDYREQRDDLRDDQAFNNRPTSYDREEYQPYLEPSTSHSHHNSDNSLSPPVDHFYSNPYNDGTSLQRRTTSIHRTDRNSNINIPRKKFIVEQDLREHADNIFKCMQKNEDLNENTPEGEELRKLTLKDMPQSLTIKKLVKDKYKKSTDRISNGNVGMFKMMKYRIAMAWSHLKSNIKDLAYMFELWYSSLKKIEGNFGSGVASYFKFLRWLFVINIAMTAVCICFVTIPQAVSNSNKSDETQPEFSGMDILTGHGYLNKSLMYYGSYSNDGTGYEISSAYYYTMPIVYILVFILISISMASSYKKSFIITKHGLQNDFAQKIFCGWDYSIQTKKAADLKKASIYNELKELISDASRNDANLSCCNKFRLYVMQGVVHVFSIAVCLGIGYLMYDLLEEYYNEEQNVLLALYINIAMLVVPMIFRIISGYEGYKTPAMTLFITLSRTIFLELCVIAVLIYYGLYDASNNNDCWENKFAQEVYRLIVFDFFFSTLFLSLIDLVWFLAHRIFKSIEAPEFDIATNTLSLIYNQTLYWVGFYFSPLLGVMIVVKLFLTWYVRSLVLLYCCRAPKKSWRAAQTESWFLITAFLWCLLLLFVHGYHIFSIDSSENCGPLTGFEPIGLSSISFIIKPGVVACILIALAFGVYYLRAVAFAQIEMVNFLRYRLNLISKDKNFLLDRINKSEKDFDPTTKSDNHQQHDDPTKLAPSIKKIYENDDCVQSTNNYRNNNEDNYQQENNPRRRY